MIEEMDLVELTEDVQALNLKKGSRGCVVYVGGKRETCFVEFFDENHHTKGVEIVRVKNLKKL